MLNDFISLFFPNYCVGCKSTLVKGEDLICLNCQHQISKTNSHLESPNYIEAKFYGKVRLLYALAFFKFFRKGRVQSILHELKYGNKPEVGELIGKWYGQQLSEQAKIIHVDLIIPVPLHKAKRRRRGYNQSESFANGLAEALEIPCKPELMIRNVQTETQTHKSRFKRWENVEGIFSVTNDGEIKEKNILIVDDVITTGSTLESCAQELLNSGAKGVGVIAIAAAV